MAPDGEFIAYHIRGTLERLAGSRFEAVDSSTEWLSLPPMRIYRYRKATGRAMTATFAPPSRRGVPPALGQSPFT